MRYFSPKFLKQALMLVFLLLSLALVGCSNNNGGDDGGDDMNQASDNLVSIKMDLSNSAGLLTTDIRAVRECTGRTPVILA